jgi:hypothetical protein
MTAPTEDKPTRRGSRGGRQPCRREGCLRTVNPSNPYDYCCFLCRAIDEELTQAKRVCIAVGDIALTSQF